MYSRAGLFALVLAFSVVFTAAAPVPTANTAPPPASLSNRPPYSDALASQASSNITQTHDINTVLPSVPIAENLLAARELVPLERRRRNPFSKIKHVFKKMGNGIKKAVKFVKANGAKIAKVGLKITSAATSVAAKFVKYIPDGGTGISQGMIRASATADKASNRIHAHISGKLGKAMAGMDEAEKIAGYIPRELSEDIQLQERNLEEFEFDARDVYESDSLLDARADFEEWLYERSWDDGEDSNIY